MEAGVKISIMTTCSFKQVLEEARTKHTHEKAEAAQQQRECRAAGVPRVPRDYSWSHGVQDPNSSFGNPLDTHLMEFLPCQTFRIKKKILSTDNNQDKRDLTEEEQPLPE